MSNRITEADLQKWGVKPPGSSRKPAKRQKGLPYPMFEAMCQAHGLPRPVREYKFCKGRRWRFDFAWPEAIVSGAAHCSGDVEIALEIEGGAFAGHGHRSVGRFLGDIEKYNEAAMLGWMVFRVTTDDIETGAAFELLRRAFGVK